MMSVYVGKMAACVESGWRYRWANCVAPAGWQGVMALFPQSFINGSTSALGSPRYYMYGRASFLCSPVLVGTPYATANRVACRGDTHALPAHRVSVSWPHFV